MASYAVSSFTGTNGTGTGTTENPGGRVFGFNNDDWYQNDGPLPTDYRHVLNVAGTLTLPWRMQLSANASAYTRAPFTVYVAGADFNGDGTENDLLPGTTVNVFGRGMGKADWRGWSTRITRASARSCRYPSATNSATDSSPWTYGCHVRRR